MFYMIRRNEYLQHGIVSAVSVFVSAAIILGGTTIRTDATADVFNEDLYVAEQISSIGVYEPDDNKTEIRPGKEKRSIGVFINGKRYNGRAFLYNDTTYVGIREYSVTLAGAEVSWNGANSTATVRTPKTTVIATKGAEYISANGRYLWVKNKVLIEDGTMYVPIRQLSAAFGATVDWNGNDSTVSVIKGSGTITSGSVYYNADEVYWLSKIIHAESRGESLMGKIAVGNVVLNRKNSPDYPNTIYGVIFDRKYGVQFSPVADGSINLEPNTESVIAAKICLEGYTVSDRILFFVNKSIAANAWVTSSRPHEVTIGKHDFYA